MEEDWDNLIILDSCRYDSFEKLNPIEGTLSRKKSLGEVTSVFLKQNFDAETYHDTVYVSGNAVIGDCIDYLDVFKVVGIWGDGKRSEIDRFRDIVTPESVVETTLEMHEQHPHKRIVSHFLQPHPPFMYRDGTEIPHGSKYRDFSAAREREISSAEIRAIYEENLEYALEHIERLVEELDGKTVVTADHGDLLGEGIPTRYEILHPRWPISKRQYFDYAHYSHVRVPELVNVPWLVIEDGKRREIKEAQSTEDAELDDSCIDEQLEALGYKT
jgi:hypothetical protein